MKLCVILTNQSTLVMINLVTNFKITQPSTF